MKDKIVALHEEYCFSSARNYAGLYDDLEIVFLICFEIDCDYPVFFAPDFRNFFNKQKTE